MERRTNLDRTLFRAEYYEDWSRFVNPDDIFWIRILPTIVHSGFEPKLGQVNNWRFLSIHNECSKTFKAFSAFLRKYACNNYELNNLKYKTSIIQYFVKKGRIRSGSKTLFQIRTRIGLVREFQILPALIRIRNTGLHMPTIKKQVEHYANVIIIN